MIDLMALYKKYMSLLGKAWGGAVLGTVLLIVLIMFGFIMNLIGLKIFNAIIAPIMIASIFFLMHSPEVTGNLIIASVFAGILQQPQTVQSELKSIFQSYFKLVKTIIFFVSIVLTFLAVVPMKECPAIFFPIVTLVISLMLAFDYWNIAGKWSQRFTIAFLVIALILSFGQLIPNATYKKTLGFVPFFVFNTTETEKSLEKLDETVAEKADRKKADRIDELLKKINNNETLSDKEQAELDQTRREVDEKNLPSQAGKVGGRLVDGVGSIFSSWSSTSKKESWELVKEISINQSQLPVNLGIVLANGKHKIEPWRQGLYIHYYVSAGKYLNESITNPIFIVDSTKGKACGIGGKIGTFNLYRKKG